ncbi:MAG: TonB-dependent receptor [Chitinophagaceae bacterium]
MLSLRLNRLAVIAMLLLITPLLHAQTNAGIKGKVTSSDGQPVPSVSIILKGTKYASFTSDDGRFSMHHILPGTYTIVVSHTGLKTQQQTVTVVAEKVTEVSFSLTENSSQLEDVIVNVKKSLNTSPVTVGKVAISPMDLPQSIAVIGEGVIKDQQAMRLSDVIKNTNGVYLSTTRGSTQESFSARGYSFSSGNMFKNGARINSGAMPEVSSLEKVEVLKGSSAILYGNVAPGGIINMVTKQPKFHFGGEVSMRAGSYDLYKPAFDVYGPISSGIAFRLNGTYESAKSYRDVVSSKRYYINPSLLFKLGKRTELLVQGDYLKHNFTPDFGIGTLDNTIIPDVARSAFFGTSWQYAKTQQATANAALKHRFNESWQLTTTVSYQLYKRDYYSTERIQAAANGDWTRPLGRSNSEESYYIAQADLTGKFKTGVIDHTLLAGVDADRYFTQNYTYNQPATYDKINILDPTKYTPRTDIPDATAIRLTKTPVNRFGAYVQDLISLTPKLKLLAGVRWSYQSARPIDTINYVTNVKTSGTTIKDDKAFSPRIGLVYKPTSHTSLFASYANSFAVNSGTDIYGNALQPSIIDQYELGIKNDFFNGLLSANLTFYRIVNNNLAQTAQLDANGNVNNNTNLKELTGQTTSDGIELDLVSHPLKGLDVMAGYSYNYMRYTKTPDTKGSYVTGERLVNNPAHTANGTVFYTFTGNRLKGFKAGASVFYIGKRFGGWNNTIGQTQTYSRLIPVSGFTTVDVSLGYTYKNISLLAKVSNITNTLNYYVHENYSINPIPPRQVVATLSYRF